jgi:hypothetical protein
MSAFGGKADMTFALQMSASEPKRTLLHALSLRVRPENFFRQR